MNKLSDEQAQKLIDFVKARPALYHKQHPNYKNLEQKEKEWKMIAANLRADVKDCKSAWRCQKDQFVKRLRQYKANNSLSADEMSRKYKNFERLLFLKDSLEPRKNCSNFDGETNDLFDLNCSQTSEKEFDFVEFSSTRTVPEIYPVFTYNDMPSGSSGRISQKRKLKSEKVATYDFEHCALTSDTTSELAESPTEANEKPDCLSTTDGLNEEFTGFLKKLATTRECEEPDNVETFFQSIAKSAKAFNFTTIEISKLMLGTTELLHKIVASRQQ